MKTTFNHICLKKNIIILFLSIFIAFPKYLNASKLNDIIGSKINTLETNFTTVTPNLINLDGKHDLYFDGLDDYVAEPAVINSWEEVSLMLWVKIDKLSTGVQIIAGQRTFYIQLNANKSITAFANSKTLTSKTLLNSNQWYNISVTHKENAFYLYINGAVEASRLSAAGAINRDTSSFTIGRYPDNSSNYFNGSIDEFRLFNKALSENELQKIVYQEIENNNGIIIGSTLPKNITDFDSETDTSTPLLWENLKRYYRMDSIEDNYLTDSANTTTDNQTQALAHNIEIVNEQSAPLPFVTIQSGFLENAITNTTKGINGEDVTNYPWSIVHIKHNDIFSTSSETFGGLIIDKFDTELTPITYSIRNDSELNIIWYLDLNGIIYLDGQSQLLQGKASTLAVSSEGVILQNKQLEGDIYTYNYWSSPVGQSNKTTNNNNYKLSNIITNLNFLRSGYDGTETSIADYWIWKYCNLMNYDYPVWQHVRSTGTLNAGEGFTMKGTGTGTEKTLQDYSIEGKPNNGDISIPVYAGNEYLVGNPYPSAIDAQQFIIDNSEENSGSTSGTIYFKEHYSGGTHTSTNFEGGYATYSLSGAVPAMWQGTNEVSLTTPKQYIPIGQAFFVIAEKTGSVNFNNGQRAFHIENETNSQPAKSLVSKTETDVDNRAKLRIGFNSINQLHRQLLVTEDANATADYDWGYDAKSIDSQIDDMYWLINDEKFNIQGIDIIDESTIIPLGIHTGTAGINTISIDELENFPENLSIFIHDNELNINHNLNDGDYTVSLDAGEYLNRFEIIFSEQTTLATIDFESDSVELSYTNAENKIIISNPKSQHIQSISLYNIYGQNIIELVPESNNNLIEYQTEPLIAGIYILNVNTKLGETSKKIMVQ